MGFPTAQGEPVFQWVNKKVLLNIIYSLMLQIQMCVVCFVFTGCFSVTCIRRDRSLWACLRCRVRSPLCHRSNGRNSVQIPWCKSRVAPRRSRCCDKRPPRTGPGIGARKQVGAHTIKHNGGARLPEWIWQELSMHVCKKMPKQITPNPLKVLDYCPNV